MSAMLKGERCEYRHRILYPNGYISVQSGLGAYQWINTSQFKGNWDGDGKVAKASGLLGERLSALFDSFKSASKILTTSRDPKWDMYIKNMDPRILEKQFKAV